MNTSAGAPASICLARVGLAPYEVVAFWPVCAPYKPLISSSAVLRLAAAKISRVGRCADAMDARPSTANNNVDKMSSRTAIIRMRQAMSFPISMDQVTLYSDGYLVVVKGSV